MNKWEKEKTRSELANCLIGDTKDIGVSLSDNPRGGSSVGLAGNQLSRWRKAIGGPGK